MIKSKMFTAALLSVVALVMLAAASVAWFTISTNPESSGLTVEMSTADKLQISSDGTEWDDTLDLSESFKYYAPLKPVSTVDGLNWFLPEYYTDGSLKAATDFQLDDALEYANSLIYKKIGTKWEAMSGNALQEASNNGYYVYSDFYIKTEADEADVHISFPNEYAYSLRDEEETGINSTDGSYVLPKYAIEETEEGSGTYVLKNKGQNAQNTVRVGLLINPDYTDYTNVPESKRVYPDQNTPYEENVFYIYEPNADMRSETSKPKTSELSTSERYIINYDYTYTEDEEGTVIPDDYKEDYYYETLPIMKTDVAEKEEGGVVTKYKYSQTRIDPRRLVAQKACYWNLESLETTIKAAQLEGSDKWWSSFDIQYPYGSFLNAYSLYNGTEYDGTIYNGLVTRNTGTSKEGTGAGLQLNYPYTVKEKQPVLDENGDKTYDKNGDLIEELKDVTYYKTPYDSDPEYGSSQSLITLQKDKPVRIRLFIWIEGQDIDCWNDIAAGGFVVNLELGSELHNDETPVAPTVTLKSASGFVVSGSEKWTKDDTYFVVTNPGEVSIDHYEYRYRKATEGVSIDSVAWSEWNEYSSLYTKFTETGKYEVEFRAVSSSGTASETSTTVSFCILKSPVPEINVTGTAISGWYSGDTTISASIPADTEYLNKLTIQYRIDDGNWTDGASVEGIDGTHIYSFRTVATEFEFEYESSSVTISIEKICPEINVSATSGGSVYRSGDTTNQNVVFTLSTTGTKHDELRYTYYYSIDGGEKIALQDDVITYTAYRSGTYTFTVKSNVGAESDPSEWTVNIQTAKLATSSKKTATQ